MTVDHSKPYPVWTVAEAKARLSEILRLAEKDFGSRSNRSSSIWAATHRRQEGFHRSAGTYMAESDFPS